MQADFVLGVQEYRLGHILSLSLCVCVCVYVCVCEHFQISSPLKPLGRLQPNFMCGPHGMDKRKFVQMVQGIYCIHLDLHCCQSLVN